MEALLLLTMMLKLLPALTLILLLAWVLLALMLKSLPLLWLRLLILLLPPALMLVERYLQIEEESGPESSSGVRTCCEACNARSSDI